MLGLILASPAPAGAIPVFAHRYGLTCQACHTVVPHLTRFGEAFLAAGYRIQGLKPLPAEPVAVRFEAAYSSGTADPNEAEGGPLPKTIVDEIEFLSGGAVGTRGSYWAELYAVDGGFPGHARDVWYAQRLTPDGAAIPIRVRAGQFTLPLPLDPETFRETTQHYAIWDQTAGIAPFNFFDPKIGGQIELGDPARGLAGTASFLQGHDLQSGLPSRGVDTMFTLRRDLGPFSVQLYRYDGTRELAGYGFDGTQFFSGIRDRFWRDGYGLTWSRGRTELNAVYQLGNDSAADVYGGALVTSGGFVQARVAIGERAFAIARWDATQDASFGRAITAGVGYRPARNARLTLFDTAQRDFTGRLLHTISSSFLIAY